MTKTTRNALLVLCLSGCVDLDAQRDLPSDDNYSLTNAGAEALDDGGDPRGFGDLPVELPPDASVSWRIPAMPIVQSSAEPTSIAIDLTPAPVIYSQRIVDDYVRVPVTPSWSCDPAFCRGAPDDPADSTRDGTLHPTWNLRVIDDASGEVVCQGSTSLACTIPGLATGAAPRALTVYAIAAADPALSPAANAADRTLLGLAYYGVETDSYDACLASKIVNHPDAGVVDQWVCTERARFTRFVALDDATVTFGPATFTMQTEDGEPLTYTSESMTWATGDQDLPGPK